MAQKKKSMQIADKPSDDFDIFDALEDDKHEKELNDIKQEAVIHAEKAAQASVDEVHSIEPTPSAPKKSGFFSKLFGKKHDTQMSEIEDSMKELDKKMEEKPTLPASDFTEDEKRKSRITQEKKLLDQKKKRHDKEIQLKRENLQSLEGEIQNMGKDVITKRKKLESEIDHIKSTRKEIDTLKGNIEKQEKLAITKSEQAQSKLLEIQKKEEEVNARLRQLDSEQKALATKTKQFEDEVGVVFKKKEFEETVKILETNVKKLRKQHLDNATKVEAFTKHQILSLVTLTKDYLKLQQHEKAKQVFELLDNLYTSVKFPAKEAHELKLTIQQLYNEINLGLIGK